MYEIFKRVINRRDYNLSDLLTKLKENYIDNSLTKEQYDELLDLARTNADFHNSIILSQWMEEVERRLADLENTNKPIPEQPEEYVPGKWYHNGDKVTFNGKQYKCIAPIGQTCVWSPDEYPTYWEKVV